MIAALAYVDLNPIRAGIAQTPEESDFTAIQQRLGYAPEAETEAEPEPEKAAEAEGVVASEGAADDSEAEAPEPLPKAPLMSFDATGHTPTAIPYAWDDYLELMDWLGRAAHPAKRGRIPADQPRILDRLGVDAEALAEQADSFLRRFGAAVGAPQSPTEARAHRQQAYLRGIRMAKRLFCREAVA